MRALAVDLLAPVLLTTSALLPLTFLPVVEDSFALPKFVFLSAASVLVFAGIAYHLRSDETRKTITFPLALPLVGYLLLSALAFAMSTDHGRSLVGERLQYQG